MNNRRNFLKQTLAIGAASCLPYQLTAQEKNERKMIWADLIHLSYNMWEDNLPEQFKDDNLNCETCADARAWAHGYRQQLTFDENVWNTLLKSMVANDLNMVIIDLGDGIRYESHPEIAVKNAWTPEKLRLELKKMRELGIEPIPKLNFAATHDIWLGEYSRMVSTKKYYEVCRDLIKEVIELFDVPRFFHLGMDEETADHQKRLDYVVIRQNDLWWKDFYFYVGEVEKKNVRSWVWSDYAWHQPDIFFKKMPKSVLQSNWYYGETLNPDNTSVKLYDELESRGYDQVPTGSNHSNDTNMEATVEYCKKRIDPSRLYGFMTAPWRPTLPPCLPNHINAIQQLGRAIKNKI
jgi:hypothetical protein